MKKPFEFFFPYSSLISGPPSHRCWRPEFWSLDSEFWTPGSRCGGGGRGYREVGVLLLVFVGVGTGDR